MDAEVYPDPKVAELVTGSFVPLRAHIKEQPKVFERFDAQWTPTIIVHDGKAERHRIEGFLPARELIDQLRLGLAHAARAAGRFDDAESLYRELSDGSAGQDVAAEALYWRGVSRYKATGDAEALKQTAGWFRERFSDSAWAKKASIWG